MLKTRVVTALVLLAIFLSAIFYLPPFGWAVFVTVVAAIGAWEWGGLLAWRGHSRIALGAAFAALCFLLVLWRPAAFALTADFDATAWVLGRWFYLPSLVFWALCVPLWMRRRWPLPKGAGGVLIGALVLLPAWLALIQLRQMGEGALLAVMAIVWLADIAAYFSGRRFGRHKLAPNISPGKTWEGAFGAGIAVMLYGFMFYARLPSGIADNFLVLGLVMIALTAISIVGDLFESMLKRQAGLKDSSNVLPGHGGVLDRIDSLTSTLPLVALIWLLQPN